MKNLFVLLALCLSFSFLSAQSNSDKAGVEKACMNYIEGFYEGDTNKLKTCLQPTLNKFGFWKNDDNKTFRQVAHMSFDQALNYAKNVLEKKEFPKADAPKKVEVLDIGNKIASAKVTAWWGIDFMLLSKRGDKWMIEQVLWEGPYKEE